MLKSELDKLLTEGMMQGRNPKVLARHLTKTFGTSKYNAERLMRTELARVQIAAQEKSYLDNGWTEFEFVSIGSACSVCLALDGKHFEVKNMTIAENAPPMHPNCRCSTAPYEGGEEYEKWINSYGEHGLSFEEWKEHIAQTNSTGIMKSGAANGAYNYTNDPSGSKRQKIADAYYEQIRNRDRKYEIKAVAKNTGFKEEDVDKVFAHIFEVKHLFEDGTIHLFDSDYYMQHSWMRLREGNNIQPHDITMLKHELAEANIMGKGTDVVYETAHKKVEKKYNYQKELLEYLKSHEA